MKSGGNNAGILRSLGQGTVALLLVVLAVAFAAVVKPDLSRLGLSIIIATAACTLIYALGWVAHRLGWMSGPAKSTDHQGYIESVSKEQNYRIVTRFDKIASTVFTSPKWYLFFVLSILVINLVGVWSIYWPEHSKVGDLFAKSETKGMLVFLGLVCSSAGVIILATTVFALGRILTFDRGFKALTEILERESGRKAARDDLGNKAE